MLTKEQSRERWKQAQKLFCDWGPIGCEVPNDEYDCMIGPALRLLERGAPPTELSEYLEHELADHFGLTIKLGHAAEFSQQLAKWYLNKWAPKTTGRK